MKIVLRTGASLRSKLFTKVIGQNSPLAGKDLKSQFQQKLIFYEKVIAIKQKTNRLGQVCTTTTSQLVGGNRKRSKQSRNSDQKSLET